MVLIVWDVFADLSEVEDVLGDRKDVTGDDLDKMKYIEQVLGLVTNIAPHTGRPYIYC